MRLRLGILVVLAIGLFTVMLAMFGNLTGLLQRTTTYTVRFTDAPGLSAGAPVRRSGVRIGTVRDITLDEDRGIVRVRLAIDHPYRIRRSEVPTLVAGLLGGDVGVDLVGREPEDREPPDRTPFEPGAEILGARGASVNTLLRGASEVVPTTQQTLNEIRKSVQRLEKFVVRAEKTIPLAEETLRVYRDLGNDARKQLLPEIRKTNEEIRKTNSQIQQLVRRSDEVVLEVQRTGEEYRTLARDARATIPEIMKTNRQVADTAKSFQELTPGIQSTLDEYRSLASDSRKMLPVVRNNVEDMGAAARSIARLTERADVILQGNQDRIEKSLENLNKTLSGAARLFDEENVKNASTTLANVTKASEKFPSLADNADVFLRQGISTLQRIGESLNRVDSALLDAQRVLRPLGERGPTFTRNFDESMQRLNKILADFQPRSPSIARNLDESTQRANLILSNVQSRSPTTLKNLDEAMAKINDILGDARALMRAIDKAEGSFRKFLTDPSLYNNADMAVLGVTKMLPRLEQILKDFQVFADKLARHPEAIGLGGVVRPGSGLKGPPTPPIQPQVPPGHMGHPVQVFTPKK